MIHKAVELHYDYLFLIDSDVLIHPRTVQHLIHAKKDIISEIFWTQWWPESELSPQVWIRDQFTQWHKNPGEELNDEEISIRTREFIDQLKVPGIYEVGGLGACTLISRHALTSGVNFKKIKNLSFVGEDRHFCIRAAALGFSMYVDTFYPAYHIYRDTDIEGAKTFLSNMEKENPSAKMETKPDLPPVKPYRPKLTLSMVVKNEADRYLKQVLKEHLQYIDNAVIIDDGSTDSTVQVCFDMLKDIPLHIIKNETYSGSSDGKKHLKRILNGY